MWNDLRAKILEKLTARTGTGKPFFSAFDNHQDDFGGFPVATFEPTSKEENFSALSENREVYTFEIVVHQTVENVGKSEAIKIVGDCLDAVSSDFRDDYTLGGIARLVRPTGADWGTYPTGQGWIVYGSVKLIIEVDIV